MTEALSESYRFRDEIVAHLERDLYGPAATDEVLSDYPLEAYVTGILYPNTDQPIDAAQDIGADDQDDETTFADPPVALANARYPASVGITFGVDLSQTDTIQVTIGAAMYVAAERAEGHAWERRPLVTEPVTLKVDRPLADHRVALPEQLQLYARVRPADSAGSASITLALVNTRSGRPGARDGDCFYQTSIEVSSPDGRSVFVERQAQRMVQIDDDDLRSYRLLYRDAKTFAIGHGCAAKWKHTAGESHANAVATTFIPAHPLSLADSNPTITSEALSLAYLSEAPRTDVLDGLVGLCDQYAAWIAEQRARIPGLDTELHEIASEHLQACTECLDRIRDGIDVLRGNDAAWEAFRLANRAMWTQRARSTWIRSGKTTPSPDYEGRHEWRPFQLAFILQCLRGVTTPQHQDRRLADLLWFPTGGGKTEAYLGLIAFVIFHRRLRPGTGDGVTVLMRYTLRLLTIQQFDRAALLITCCEDLRRSDPRLGTAEISIGLWVGQGGSPNTLDQARHALERLRNDQDVDEANPIQLRTCPWCGETLGPYQYQISDEPRLIVKCRDKNCAFANGLPVLLVDEDIYRQRPTLIIATSDKFATMPWNPDTMALFNRPSRDTGRPN